MLGHTKFEPDRFSRFDVYWIQTDKQSFYYIYIYINKKVVISASVLMSDQNSGTP